MAKPEWGMKRTCYSCGTKFYDLRRDPMVCPSCGTTFDPDRVHRTRRASPVKAVPKAVVEEDPEDLDENEALDEVEDEDEGLMEDASDLGEDDSDMAEVMEHVDGGLDEKE